MSSWDFGGGSSPSTPAGGWGDLPPSAPPPRDPSGFDPGPDRSGSVPSGPVSPPWAILAASYAVVAAGAVVGLLTDAVPFAVLGWVLAGPVGVSLLGLFVHVDTRRRAEPWYAGSTTADVARRALVLLSLAVVVLNTWPVADELSRRGGA